MMAVQWKERYAARTEYMRSSAIRELLKITEHPDFISFAGGLPAPEMFPLDEVAAVSERVLRTDGATALQYGATEGYRPLRELIALRLNARGVPATVDNVLITTGSQQGLDLVGRTLINEDDTVVMETPTYVGALQAWRSLAPHFVGVAMDECGMLTEQLGEIGSFKLTYLLPNFQNPSGISLSQERRIKALELAQRDHFLIVEDDPYRELRYTGQDVPALVETEATMLGSNWNTGTKVVHLGSFSKTLSPGLRLGWMLASEPMIHTCVMAKQGTDLHSSALSQMIVEDLLRHHTLEKNIPKIRTLYRERRDTMLDVLGSRL